MQDLEKPNKIAKLSLLALAALGVVYGDIGTSPLYTINQIFFGFGHTAVNTQNILGCISLVFWALTITVTFKYIIFVLRADYDGEGGVFALFALLKTYNSNLFIFLKYILILAAGLLFGDGIITPAISVLSAVEGLKVASNAFHPYIIPLTLVILTVLFAFQHKGTTKIGKIFGPIILVWFISIAIFGLKQVAASPGILLALNPVLAWNFLIRSNFATILLTLGSVMLAVTGGEALYADLGHFGKRPIRLSWFIIVYPALILCYFGQGAYLLSNNQIFEHNVFYSMVPSFALYPMIILATFTTIIASQALISGVFSLASQAMALDLLPRIKAIHTHAEHVGQIYVPFMNWALYTGCILLVLGFQSSNALASAYGLAVSGVMFATSISMIMVAIKKWHWRKIYAILLFGVFAIVDMAFLFANSLKFFHGGHIPIFIGSALFVIITTWKWGRARLKEAYEKRGNLTIQNLLEAKKTSEKFFPRSMVILTPKAAHNLTDPAQDLLQMFWERYGMFPKRLILLTFSLKIAPYIRGDRYRITIFQNDKKGTFISVEASFGFMEAPDMEKVLREIALKRELAIEDNFKDWIIHVGNKRMLVAKESSWFTKLRFKIFKSLVTNSEPSYEYFGLRDDTRLCTDVIGVEIS
jgi:KUP system potassium uptake protein